VYLPGPLTQEAPGGGALEDDDDAEERAGQAGEPLSGVL